MFGDRLHLRVRQGKSQEVIANLEQRIPAAGGEVAQIHSIPPGLEDVFISLLEDSHG
jgi:hypothetical protein